jgi:hypothetical protein
MVDTTLAAVCEDPVIFVIKAATNMTATMTVFQYKEQYKQGTPIMPRNTVRSCDEITVHVTSDTKCSFVPNMILIKVIEYDPQK